MKFLEVLDTDMKMLAQLINMLQVGEYRLSGKDLCASADTIRWLQNTAKSAADCYSLSKNPIAAKEDEYKSLPSTNGLGEGVNIKSFNPGKAGRSK